MKKIKYIGILITLLVFTFTSCEKTTLEQSDIDFVTFEGSSKSLIIVKDGSVSTDIKVYTANKVNSNQVINLSIATSLEASTYTAPSSVTIPAGSNEGVFSLSFNDVDYDFENGETMSISFDPFENYFSGDTTIDIDIAVVCPINLEGLVGTYSGTDNWYASVGGPLDVSITTAVNGSTFTATGLGSAWLENPAFWAEEVVEEGDVEMTIDSDTGAITIPYQFVATTLYLGSPGDYFITGAGTYSSCTDTFYIEYELFYAPGADVASGFGVPGFKWRQTLTR